MAVMRNALDQWQLQSPIYFVTDGSGRQWVAATNIGTMPDDYRPGAGTDKSHWRYAGGTARAEGFGASRFAGTSPYTSGLAFFRNRTYDQRTGRWTQEDPLGVAGGLNLYQFNGNNPVSYTDPFGLCPPIDDCLQKLANWGAQRGGAVGTAVLNTAAGLNAVNDVNPVSAAFDAGYDIGSGHVVRGLAMAAFTVGGGAAGRGLTRASSGLRALFAEGGGLADESIIGIRATLRENGFIMKLSENKKGYLFTNGTGEEVRVMPGANGWYMRVKNAFNNYLDAVANPASDATTHLPITNR
jgi:RHS repeat-associated protein